MRYYDVVGTRRRLRCASREEADFERARLVLAEARGELVAASHVETAGAELTLAGFWPMYRADAKSRLAPSTLREYERIWDRRLGPRFGRFPLGAIRPRLVSEWRAELLAAGVGAEAVRYAMVLLQAMFTLAIEWGEAQANPGSVVRKPRQGRSSRSRPRTSSVCAWSCSTTATTAPPRWSASSPTPAYGPARHSVSNGVLRQEAGVSPA